MHDAITGFSPKLPYLHITTEGFKIGTEKIAIFSTLLGGVEGFGTWFYSEMSVLCFLAALLLGVIYKVNPFEGMMNGLKKTLKPVGMLFLSYVVLYFAANQMFYQTLAELLLGLTSKFSVVISSIVMAIASFFHVDIFFVSNYAAPQMIAHNGSSSLVGLLTQSIYGVTMFIAPTSIYLTYGLTYFFLCLEN